MSACLRVMTIKLYNSTAMAVPCNRRPRWRPICTASSNFNPEQLRSQLDQLHAEAETTRTKANNARLRLLRLSEAAENLQKQAAINVQKGKEQDARESLFQKKKVMQVLEKSKNRIELLDELSSKLNEAVSLKESQLVGSIASDLEGNTKDVMGPLRIFYPNNEVKEDQTEGRSNPSLMKSRENHNSQRCWDKEGSTHSNDANVDGCLGLSSVDSFQEDSSVYSMGEINSYDVLMERLDQQLEKFEAGLLTLLKASNLLMDNEERTMNSKVKHTVEVLEGIYCLRQRDLLHKPLIEDTREDQERLKFSLEVAITNSVGEKKGKMR